MCLGTNGAHYPLDKGRELHAIHPLYSITHNRMIRLEVTCPDEDPRIPSIVSVYPGNDWQERETWDLIGIVFTGHPSLTRTAMPDDWVGHPSARTTRWAASPSNSRAPSTLPPTFVGV